jgi:hypothetical protein
MIYYLDRMTDRLDKKHFEGKNYLRPWQTYQLSTLWFETYIPLRDNKLLPPISSELYGTMLDEREKEYLRMHRPVDD